MHKILCAKRIDKTEYTDECVIAATDPSEAVRLYNKKYNTKDGAYICLMFDDEKEGPISKADIYEYLKHITGKLFIMIDLYNKERK